MAARSAVVSLFLLGLTILSAPASAETPNDWWNPRWRLRTTVTRPTPCRQAGPRPVEIPIDLTRFLGTEERKKRFDPATVRVIERVGHGAMREVPCVWRVDTDPEQVRPRAYLTWIARPAVGDLPTFDIYFGTNDLGIEAPSYDAADLPPENLLRNPGFEQTADGQPAEWKVSSPELVRLGRFPHTTGERSLSVVVDDNTPEKARREVTLSQRIDVGRWAGQEMVFECDLLAERAAYGAPVSIELEQHRADGSRIPEYAVEPRWLTIELARGQLVQFCQRGRFGPETATVDVRVRMRPYVHDADTGRRVTGPESHFTVWMDRLVVRPGERWRWPPAANRGFVEGALPGTPLNRGFEFTGQRRLAFHGASEGTLTAGVYNPDPQSVHWGLESGTLEFRCQTKWNADDGRRHVFFEGIAYGHRLQSRLCKLDAAGGNQLEFTIADAGGKLHTIRADAPLRAAQWHHMAATWDFPRARLQLFVDGKRVAAEGPAKTAWPSSLVAEGGPKKTPGIGIMEKDTRSLPMQAFLGGDRSCGPETSAEAVLDEIRISDVARYDGPFEPAGEEFAPDRHTRALFHLENEHHGVHGGDDRFVRGHLVCEGLREEGVVQWQALEDGKVGRPMGIKRKLISSVDFEHNRAEKRLKVTRPFDPMPDPRNVEYRPRRVERTVTDTDDTLSITVGGDYEPLMQSITFEHADESSQQTTLLPRWRANDNVVPLSFADLAATLAPDATGDAKRAFEVFRYALAATNYYDAHYCETLPDGRHRPRVSYTLTKAVNIYPFDQCGPLNHTLRKLFLAGGISSNDASGTHHQFQQAYYGGDWRLFDLSPRLYWLEHDGTSVAGRRDFEEDPHLKVRQGSAINSALRGRKGRARFGRAERPHAMDFPLRPGERVSFCWHNEGRWFEVTGPREPIPLAKIPPYFGNGAILFEPTGRGEAAVLENMAVDTSGDGRRVLHAKDPAKDASLIYRACCPYIFSDATVTGTLASETDNPLTLSLSFDQGKTWTQLAGPAAAPGPIEAGFRDQVTGRYVYWLKLELAPGSKATLADLRVRTTLVASPLALPGRLRKGENRVRFVGGPVRAPVKTECRWIERHRSDVGVAIDSIAYHMNDDQAHRNVLIAPPGGKLPVRVMLRGGPFRGEVSVDGLPRGWAAQPAVGRAAVKGHDLRPAVVELTVKPTTEPEGTIRAFHVVLRQGDQIRRVPVQVLVATAPLVREAERADRLEGTARVASMREMRCPGEQSSAGEIIIRRPSTDGGRLSFDFETAQSGRHALWLRARWPEGSDTSMTLALDGAVPRRLRAQAMIGFTDWTDPRAAHTKMFAHYGEQYAHWSWYRVPDVELTAGKHTLILGAQSGARFDAVLLLPQTPTMDRAAMNLLQNWNYAPWDNPW